MNLIKLIKNRLTIFLIQISILIAAISFFEYNYDLNLQLFPKPDDTVVEQIFIIEWLVNYILFKSYEDMILIFTIWFIISIIPVLIYNDYKEVYSMNLITFFFSNFFFYAFLLNYYRPYFNANFLNLFIKTLILGITMIFFSIGTSLTLKAIRRPKFEMQQEDLHQIAESIRSKCPQCGTEFNSKPLFCYNCNYELKTGN
ncbi:hypothetical protein LCGC14_1237590 [marine sediment metagenome]|uniref:Zinc-ribbon domain-containing protein n=1 Tax=marine sediment metagenome TaxID=412755 RepID=A0A0F9LTW2_9ZZZZ